MHTHWLGKKRMWLATIIACAGIVSGFAVASAGARSARAASLTAVTMYLNPGSADASGAFYCIKSGICAKHGLKVTIKASTQGGPQIIPALTSGQVQFGEPGYEDTIVAASKGIPLVAIGPASVAATSDASDWTADLSLKSGSVKTICNLPGQKVAVNSLLGLGQLFVDADYYNAHCKGDPSDTGWKRIKFVAILFPQMTTALQKGEVGAIWTLEPFLSLTEHQLKTTLLAGSAYRTVPHGPITAIDTSKAYLHSNPQIVYQMQLAMQQSNEYLAAHPSETRKLIGEDTTTPKSQLAGLILPTFTATVPLSYVQKEAVFNKMFGLISKIPNVNSYNVPDPINPSKY
jgi:NitT/TauT family transport system substrate-binding protein